MRIPLYFNIKLAHTKNALVHQTGMKERRLYESVLCRKTVIWGFVNDMEVISSGVVKFLMLKVNSRNYDSSKVLNFSFELLTFMWDFELSTEVQ